MNYNITEGSSVLSVFRGVSNIDAIPAVRLWVGLLSNLLLVLGTAFLVSAGDLESDNGSDGGTGSPVSECAAPGSR